MNKRISTALCPQCGAQGTAGRFCEYCGTRIPMPHVNNTQNDANKDLRQHLIHFNSTAADIRDLVLSKLVENRVPADVFEKIGDISITKYYVPMYNFVGSFQASWNCTQVIKVQKSRRFYDKNGDPKTEYYTENEYHPTSGVVNGRFDILCSASSLARDYDFENYHNSVPYEESLLDKDALVLPFDDEEYTNWNTYAGDIIDQIARANAYKQAPTPNEQFSTSASWNKEDNVIKVFAPMWMVAFNYNGADYVSYLRGDFPNAKSISIPIDKEAEEYIKNLRSKRKDSDKLAVQTFALIFLMVLCFGLAYWTSLHWPRFHFFELPGCIMTVVTIIGLLIARATYKKGESYNQRLESYIAKLSNNELEIRRINAKKYFDYGDVEIKNVETSDKKEPNKPSFTWITLSILAMFAALLLTFYITENRYVAIDKELVNDAITSVVNRVENNLVTVTEGGFKFKYREETVKDYEYNIVVDDKDHGSNYPKHADRYEVDKFFEKLNTKTKRHYRLPTKKEKEYIDSKSYCGHFWTQDYDSYSGEILIVAD